MKIKKIVFSSIILSSLFVIPAQAFDQYITVKFKTSLDKNYLEELNKRTGTSVSKIIEKNKYKFKIEKIGNNELVDKYAELFSYLKNVENVSPVPKQKIGDKFNTVLYIQNEIKSTKTIDNKKEPTETTVDNVVPDEIIIKFNQETSLEEIKNLNDSFGGQISYQKETDSYKIKIPEYVDYDYAKNFYENNRLVKSINESITTSTIKKPIPANPPKVTSKDSKGLISTLPITETSELKINFKIGEDEEGYKWINENFGAELVHIKGFSTYIVRIPSNINIKALSRGLKVCPFISSVELFYGS